MGRHRGAFRYPVAMPVRLLPEGEAGAGARLVDLSRTGAGLVGPAEALAALAAGRAVRLLADDAVEGRRVVRQWLGKVTHASARDDGLCRLGVAFDAPLSAGPGGTHPARLADLFPAAPAAAPAGAAVALAGLALDQASKAWAWGLAGTGGALPLVPDWLTVAPVENHGAVAGLAGSLPATGPLLALAALAIAALHRPRGVAAVGPGLLAAGLVGNALDRLALGHVRDFLVCGLCPDLSFNVADLLLLGGALACLTARAGRE